MLIYFTGLILLTGALTTYTDIREKKIKNLHLLIISVFAIILYGAHIGAGTLKLSLPMVVNPLVGLTMGFILYTSGLWKAGDAKLFATYSLLLPINGYSSILPLSCLTLFINTFLLSFLFLLPLLVYDIIHNKNRLFKKAALKGAGLFFIQIFLIMLCVSWVIQPLLFLIPLKANFFLNFIFLFSGYWVIFKVMGGLKNKLLVGVILAAGLILRGFFTPDFFTVANIANFLRFTLLYTTLFYILNAVISIKEERPMRIPFSPFMCAGAVLTNTEFLSWVIALGSAAYR